MEEHEDGVSQVMIERLVERTLPVLLEIKGHVDAGKSLTEGEMEIMDRLISRAQARKYTQFLEMHDQYKPLVAKVIDLYEEITETALRNEIEK